MYILKILFISDFDDDFAPDFGSCHRCGWNKVGLNNVTESAASFEPVYVEFNEEKDVPTFLHVATMSAGKLFYGPNILKVNFANELKIAIEIGGHKILDCVQILLKK